MNREINPELLAFIMGVARMKKNYSFSLDTGIEKDLGISGTDAAELMEEFGQKFNIDVSELNLDDYFCPEYDGMLMQIIDLIRGRKRDFVKKELTIADLQQAIILKKLK